MFSTNYQNSNGLKDVFVLRDSGECVFHSSYSRPDERIEADQTIMSSFLSAIEMFSSNVDQGARMLETTNYRFVYHKNDEYIYVARTEKSANPDKISRKLNLISSAVKEWLPNKWDGNVKVFQGVGSLVKEQFSNPGISKFYEITGKDTKDLRGIEEKIYSFLRFKGRSSLSSIIKLMKIPEEDAHQVAEDLVTNNYLTSCS